MRRVLAAGVFLAICAPLRAKLLPPCAAQVKCEVAGDQVRCAPKLLSPQLCEVGAMDVAIAWEVVRPSARGPTAALEAETVSLESVRWQRAPSVSAPAPVFVRALNAPAEYRVRLLLREAATGRLLATASAYLVRDGSRYVCARNHPAIESRPVRVHQVQFDGARLGAPTSAAAGVTIQGRILYRDFPPSPDGYKAPIEVSARGLDIVIAGLDPPASSVSTRTDSDGFFRAATDLPIGSRVGITFTASSAAAIVQDNVGTTYTWTTNGTPATVTADPFVLGTVVVEEAQDGGALNILDVIQGEFLYATARGAAAPPRVTVVWKKGVDDSTFSDGTRILLLNAGASATDDTDEWDDQVIAHEYAHHVQFHASCNLSPGGGWLNCGSYLPELAWIEGSANYLSVLVSSLDPHIDHTGTSYLDLVGNFAAGSHVAFNLDLENDVCSGAGGERVPGAVANLLWDLQDDAVDPPDTYTRSEADLFRLILGMRNASRCDVDEFLSALCGTYPGDVEKFSGLLTFYGLPPAGPCPSGARLSVARPNARRPARIVPPR